MNHNRSNYVTGLEHTKMSARRHLKYYCNYN